MTVAVEPKIYKIPGTNLAAFAEKLRTLSKRSKKIGMPGVGFTMLSTQTETTEDHEIVTYHYVTLSGEMPRVSGWEILGYLERCGAANLINTRDGVEIPEEHRYEMRCDHCGVNRARAKTYVLRNVITGDVRQVGTTCLQDFVGSDTIDDAAAWFEMILEAESSAGMSEIESYGGNQDATYALPAFLAHVSATMRAFGWVSGSDAYNDYRKTSTAEEAWLHTLAESMQGRSSFQHECTPGYYNNEGRPGEGPGWFGGNYGGGAQAFFTILRDWRAKGDFDGIETA